MSTSLAKILKNSALTMGIAASGTPTLADPQPQTWVQRQSTDIEKHLGSIPLRDQHGEPLDLAKQAGEGPAIFIFGWSGCKFCLGTQQDPAAADTLAGMQEEFKRLGIHVRTFVISTTPADDEVPEQREGYVTSLAQRGVRQFADENIGNDAQRAEAYRNAKGRQDDRLLTIVYMGDKDAPAAKREAMVEQLQQDLGLAQNKHSAKNHSFYAVLFNDGKQQFFKDKTNPDPKYQEPGRWTIPSKKMVEGAKGEEAIRIYREHGKEIAKEFANRIAQGHVRG